MTDVLIVGSGITGLACGRSLHAAGLDVCVIDKGRGIGGRMATKRIDVDGVTLRFDHGAQYLPDGPESTEMATAAPGALALCEVEPGKPRYVGVAGMSSLPKALASGLNVTQGCRATEVRQSTDGVDVVTTDGMFSARTVVLSVPAPQIMDLLGPDHKLVKDVAPVVMDPCLTLMAAFEDGAAASFTTRRNPHRPLSWIALDSRKPGRTGAARTWVAQACAEWSAPRLDKDMRVVCDEMVRLLCEETGEDRGHLRHASVHRWRYAQASDPLGVPFLQDGPLYVGGDWTLGATAQHAWRSGQSIADSILQSRPFC